MRFTAESIRQRWLVMLVAWAIGATLLVMHARAVDQYLSILGQLGLRGAPAASTPLTQTYPAFAADGQVWVRHALALLEGDSLRLRYTMIDNAPAGREVHWNSAWAWTIALAGSVDHWLTGQPLPRAVERATLWLNPLTFVILTIVISTWVARRYGALLGAFVAIAMVGHPRVSEGFFPFYVDHHGLLTVAVLGLVLGATFMGIGWWQSRADDVAALLPTSTDEVRAAAKFSALSGAFGLWVSAASTLVPIGIVGVAAVATLLIQGREARRRGAQFDGDAWRLWGRMGAICSIVFYLVEYFPSQMGLRMESNHPFYALAWWGGGQLLAEFGERWLGAASERWKQPRRLILPLAAVCVAPATILIGGTGVFVVMDPFLVTLHNKYIQEFLPLWRSLRGLGWNVFFSVVGFENIPLLLGIGTLAFAGRRAPLLLWFSTTAAIIFTGMAWMQSRWLLNASGSQVALAMVLLIYFAGQRRVAVRWAVGVAATALVFLPSGITRTTNALSDVATRRVTPKDAGTALARDIAAVLRGSMPQGEITLLASPNASTSIGYYGRFRTIGTLYWENCDGLKAAAALHAARTEQEAAALVKKHGVTHIAMVSDESFIEQYYLLLHPKATAEEIKQSFGYQLLIDRKVPTWLQMIPYKVPDDLSTLKVSVMLFKVAFDQSPADALYHIAMGKITLGLLAEAEADFDTLIKQSPASPQPWLRKGELLFARHEWAASAEATYQGIVRAPAAQRPGLYAAGARNFYERQQPQQAIQLYQAALKEQFDVNLAAYLAFILATTNDDKLRNGVEALKVAELAFKADPASPTVLNSMAAALAETGKFKEAAAMADKAIANARIRNEAAIISVTEERLALYRLGRPVRR